MRLCLSLLLCLLFAGSILAQESPYEIALQRIEAAEAAGTTDIDLMGLGLTELPPEIGNLTNLQVLRLNFNQLSTLPAESGNLSNLGIAMLYSNQLTSLPSEF